MALVKFNEILTLKVTDKLKGSFGVPESEHDQARGWIEALDWAKEVAVEQFSGCMDELKLWRFIEEDEREIEEHLRKSHGRDTDYWEGRKATLGKLKLWLVWGESRG